MLSTWHEPVKAEGMSGGHHARHVVFSANDRIDRLQAWITDVDAFVGASYRTFPQPIAVEPLRGWFRWSLRMSITELADHMSRYLADIAAFHEPPIPSADSLPETRDAILRRIPELADALNLWTGLHGALRTAAEDRSAKPGVLGPDLDGTVSQIARAVATADATLRALTYQE